MFNGVAEIFPSMIKEQVIRTFIFIAITIIFLAGKRRRLNFTQGMSYGVVAGLVMVVAVMIISKFVLSLPWFMVLSLIATLVLGQGSESGISSFEASSFFVGVLTLIVLTGFLGSIFTLLVRTKAPLRLIIGGVVYSLVWWSIIQYFIWPYLSPLIIDKGFPPLWYALSFAAFGLTLGFLAVPYKITED